MAQSKGRFTSDDDFLSKMRIEMAAAGTSSVCFFLATDNRTTQEAFVDNAIGAKVSALRWLIHTG